MGMLWTDALNSGTCSPYAHQVISTMFTKIHKHMNELDARILLPRGTACTRASHVHHTDALGFREGVYRLSSRAEGVAGVFETAQVGGLTASVCRPWEPA